MEKLIKFFKNIRGTSRLGGKDPKQAALVKQGKAQFKKLMEKGINIPVALL